MISDKKKVLVVPGTERFEVPLVEKRKGQILSIGGKVSIMDLENFETIELDCPEELRPELEVNSTVEYWDIEGIKIIKRKV
jgi:translation initiation factor 5A